MVGDLMRDFKLTLDQVLQMGYYEAHRLWTIGDELRARDLQQQSLVSDFVYSDSEKRKEFLDWIRVKQPRQYQYTTDVPQEVLERFAEAWKNAR